MEKLEAVQKVLRFSNVIREWCEHEHSIYFDDFDEHNVKDYEEYADLADEIIERGIKENLLEEDMKELCSFLVYGIVEKAAHPLL